MFYSQQYVHTTNNGNNALSYEERKVKLGKAELTLPYLKQINKANQIELGDHLVLEEIDEDGILHSHTGLKHLYQIQDQSQYIFDNHNHALYFWLKRIRKHQGEKIHLIHIDQHSDLNIPSTVFDPGLLHDDEYIRRYTNFECQISSFIQPFLQSFLSVEFTWIKSEQELLDFVYEYGNTPLLLDIDMDFWAPGMSPASPDKTMSITKDLIAHASLTTIATSPMFIDQELALEYVRELL